MISVVITRCTEEPPTGALLGTHQAVHGGGDGGGGHVLGVDVVGTARVYC